MPSSQLNENKGANEIWGENQFENWDDFHLIFENYITLGLSFYEKPSILVFF